MALPFATLFSLWILLQCACIGFCDDEVIQAQLGNLTDDVLAGLETYAKDHNMTSVDLPDVKQDFTVPLWILSLTGSVNLTEGSLLNYMELKRYKDSSLIFIPTRDHLVLQTGIAIPNIEGTYDFSARAGVVKQKGKIQISVFGTKATALVSVNTKTLKVVLADFKMVDLGHIKVKVQDGVVGWLATAISNLVAELLKTDLEKIIETKMPPVVNELLEKLDLASLLQPPADLIGGK